MIKYTLVEDRWLIDDLEDEFKTTCGSLMRPTESDGFHTELGVGSAIINPDRDGPVSNWEGSTYICRELSIGVNWFRQTKIRPQTTQWYLVEEDTDG